MTAGALTAEIKRFMLGRIKPAIIAAVVLCAASTVYAHGGRPGHIDEGPGPGTWITVLMVAAWIVIALGVVFFVLRLIRGGRSRQGILENRHDGPDTAGKKKAAEEPGPKVPKEIDE